MTYEAKVITIMIASPGDVEMERNVVREIITEWNSSNSISRGVALMPLSWETHSAPDLSDRAQQVINEQVLEDADILVGIFWTRVGSPTGKAISGSVEEIEEHLKKKKPVMLYFSDKPAHPSKIDQRQYTDLGTFRDWAKSKGLIGSFSSVEDFRSQFRRQLEVILKSYQRAQDFVTSTRSEDGASARQNPRHVAQLSIPGNSSLFAPISAALAGRDEGERKALFVPSTAAAFIRIIPSGSMPLLRRSEAVELIRRGPDQLEPFYWRPTGAVYEPNEKGAIAVQADWATGRILHFAQLFLNREIWALDTVMLEPKSNGKRGIPWGSMEQAYQRCLYSYIDFSKSKLGIDAPVRIVAGASGIKDYALYFKQRYLDWDDTHYILEEEVVWSGTLNSFAKVDIDEALLKLFEAFFDAAGIERPNRLYEFPPKPHTA